MDFETDSAHTRALQRQLVDAVKLGDIDKVREICAGLPSNFDVNNVFEETYHNKRKGKPLLFLACCTNNSTEILTLLVRMGGNLRINRYEGLNAFHYACKYGRIASVECIINICHDVKFLHELSDDDQDALAYVIDSYYRKSKEAKHVIEILQTKGKVDVNRFRRIGSTELLNAVLQDNVELVEVLCSVGANVNTGSHRSYKALQWACDKGQSVEMIQLLIDNGANINESWRHCQRPIHLALKHGFSAQARVLLNAGADISGNIFLQNQKYGWISTFCLAARSCPALIPDFLARGANPNDFHPTTGLHVLGFALEKEAGREIIACLVRAGARTDNVGRGKSAIKCCENIDQILAFVDGGCSIELIENELKENLLRKAILNQSDVFFRRKTAEDRVLFLISKGAKLESESLKENSNLMLCLQNRLYEAAESFIDHGVNVNHVGENGDTALHKACKNIEDQSQEIISKLLAAGSLVNAKNDEGLTPLLLALQEKTRYSYRQCDEKTRGVMRCLIDNGADIHVRFPGTQKSTLCHAIDCRDLDTAKLLINAGYNVNKTEENGEVPIFRCFPFDFSMALDLFSLLLEAGTNPNVLDSKGKSLLERIFDLLCSSEKSNRLSYLYQTTSADVIKRNFSLLLQYKPNPNTAKEGQDSLLFKAIENEKEDLVKILIEAGAQVSHIGRNKKTALDCCCQLTESEMDDDRFLELKMTVKGKRIVDILLDASFPLDLANCEGQYPLDILMKFVNTDQQITHMLEKGADPNMYDKHEDPPILRSVYKNPTVTLALIQAGADTRAQSVNGGNFYDLFMERVFYDNSLSCLGEEFASERPSITKTSQEKVVIELRKIPSKPTFRKIELFLTNLKVSHEKTTTDAHGMIVTFQDNLTCWKTLRMLEQFPFVYTIRTLRGNGKQSVWLNVKEKLDQQRWIDRDDGSDSSKIEQSNAACEAIKSTISKGNYDVNSRTSNGVLPLCLAVKIGSLPLTRFLLEMEVNPNLTDEMDETPLYLAVQNGQMEILQLLLDAKADVNYPKESDTNEPLISRVLDGTSFLSSMERRISLTEQLIKNGADLNFCKEGDNSPLIKAVEIWSDVLVDILLKHGSHVNHQGRNMATALHFCCMRKKGVMQDDTRSSEVANPTIFRKLLESGASVNHQLCTGATPVHIAIIRRHSYMALEMINKAFEVNARNAKGVTCLMLAAEWDEEMSTDVVKALIKEGADVSLKDEEGNNVLYHLGCNGAINSLLDIFLDSGANINFANNDGYTPLNSMVKERKNLTKEDVQCMLSKGADPNNCPNGCESPLTNALLRGETDIAEILVAAGAQVNYISEAGLTALSVTLSFSRRKTKRRSKFKQNTTVNWLLDVGANPNLLTLQKQSSICILMKSPFTNNTVPTLSNLLQHGANPNLGLDNPLCSAAEVSLEAVRLLLSAHVEVNKPDIDGNTALVKCLESEIEETMEIIECLIENKADVNLVGKSGRYPIEIAIKQGHKEEKAVWYKIRCRKEEGFQKKLVCLLLSAGAKLNMRNKGEDSPLHLAVCQNCLYIVQLLISNGADVNHVGVGNQTPLHRCVDVMRMEDETIFYYDEDLYEKNYIKENDTVIDVLLANNANPNTEDANGTTPLTASLESNTKYFRKLLAAGGDPLFKGNNLYEKCSEMEDLRFLDVLLKVKGSAQVSNSLFSNVWNKLDTNRTNNESRGVLGKVFSSMLTSTNTLDVNMKNKFGDIPLIFFCGKNDADVVEKLIQRGASVNLIDDSGFTALHKSFHSPDSKEKRRILSMLLVGNPDVNAKDRSGKTLFQKAYVQYMNDGCGRIFYKTEKSNSQWLSFLIKELIKGGAEYEKENLTSLLPIASVRQHFDLMTVLIQHGADLSVTKNGAGIIHMCWSSNTQRGIGLSLRSIQLPLENPLASMKDCFDCILTFKHHGGRLNEVDKDGNTPLLAFLTSSLFSKDIEVEIEDSLVSVLACDRATVKHRNHKKFNRLAIHIAASKGRLSTLKILVNKGADLCDKDELDNNCIHLYLSSDSRMCSKELVEYLVASGVSISQINARGDTPLFVLVSKMDSSLELDNAVEHLLQNGADPNENSNNRSVLVKAIEMKKEKTVSLLLAYGAKVNEIGNEATALHVLFKNFDRYLKPYNAFEKMFHEILDKGAHVNGKDVEGNNVLHLAVMACLDEYDKSTDAESIILQLLKSGCEINAANNEGRTPLGCICYNSRYRSEAETAARLGICLLANGADPNIDFALYWALRNDNLHNHWKTLIIQIIEKTTCSNLHKGEEPSILLAIKLGDVDIVNALIGRGANIHETDRNGSGCLLLACNLEKMSEMNTVSSLLLQHGCNINKANRRGDSALSKLTERIANPKDNITITSENSKTFAEIDLSLFNQLVCGGADLTSSRYQDSLLVVLTRNGFFNAASNLVKCGYDFKRDQCFQNHNLTNQNPPRFNAGSASYERVGYEREKQEFLEVLERYKGNCVPTLSSLCRTVTRKYLVDIGRGAEIESKINQLLLPTKMKEYLTYRENIENMERMEVAETEGSSRTLDYLRPLYTASYDVINSLSQEYLDYWDDDDYYYSSDSDYY